ncbi:MAG: PAS domain-containing protein [Vicinamibacterales bacterium]
MLLYSMRSIWRSGGLFRGIHGGVVATVATLLVCGSSPAVAQDSRDARHVLALYWYAREYPSNVQFEQGLLRALRSDPRGAPEYYSEYLEIDRFPPEAHARVLRDFLRRKYKDVKIDVIVAEAWEPFQFLLADRSLFPGVPIVYNRSVAPPDASAERPAPGAVGIFTAGVYRKTLEMMRSIHPETEQVLIITGLPDNGGKNRERLVREELAPLERELTLTYLTDLETDVLLGEISRAPARSIVLYVRHSEESMGSALDPIEAVSLFARSSNVPIYGVASSHLGHGIVGGYLFDLEAIGMQSGQLALRLLAGARPEELPATSAAVISPMFDWRQLRRWGIDPSRLPPGSDIRFRTLTTWEVYRWYIVGALAVVAFQGLMIASLVIQRSRRRESEARFQRLVDHAPVLVWMSGPDKLCTYFNKPWLDFTGRTLAQELGNGWAEGVHPDDYHRCLDTYVRAFDARHSFRMEYRLRRYDGRFRWILDEGAPRTTPAGDFAGYIGSCIDITERKEAEDALRDSQERYALATVAAGVGVWDWDLETNEIYLDPALKIILGYDDHEIANHLDDWWRLVHPDDAPAVMERAREHIDGKSPFYELEYRRLHRDGSIRWFLARGSAVRRDGRAVRMIGTDTDITERKITEQALHEVQAELTRVSRLTALGEFAASVAHEVRQPLTAILMNAKACLRWFASGTPDLTEIQAALWDVVDASRRADEVIRRNHELFRHHAVQKAPFDINGIIRDVAVLARTRLQGSQVMLVTSPAASLPAVEGDRIELQQVLLNLVANAIDAMENSDPASRRIEIISSLAPAGMVEVSVTDRGVGLDGVDMQRMFTPSYTTKADGTGVGLSISRSIVEAHGGRLWAEQNSDRGATFFFTVPVSSTVAAA